MPDPVETLLESVGNDSRSFCVGEILVRRTRTGGFVLSHRDDKAADQLNAFGEEDRQFLQRAGGLIGHCLH